MEDIRSNLEVLETFFSQEQYKNQISEVSENYPEQQTVIIDYYDFEMFNSDLADLLIDKPGEVIKLAEKAVENINPLSLKLKISFINVRNQILLRNLRSKYIGSFISTDGIVRKVTSIYPRLDEAVFECMSCMRLHQIKQKDEKTLEPVLCTECGGKAFRFLHDESTFTDMQIATIQEPLENLSGGDQPRQISIILEDELVESVKPGNIIRVTGTLNTVRDERTKRFSNYIAGNYIEQLEAEFNELKLTEEDEKRIIELAEDPNIYEKIINSTAPAVYGYNEIKEAIALQLFSGEPKHLEDNTNIRGDIHILLMGDPGVAKSVILKYISKLAPKGIYTSGKGTTNAGLTAAAIKDEFGGWALEAGALVLGDMGIVCIDEFDKMRKEDQSAIHESMEQQTVSIAKAGITTTLNTRCSILAAANPKFGRFDPYKTIGEQIDLPPTILSRFDLIFIIADKPDIDNDREIAKHILHTHQTREIKYDIEPDFLKKYIAYAKRYINPTLSNEALHILEEFYMGMREPQDEESPVPITARQLEALIRLAEANAKLRLSDTVSEEDANRAIKLQQECMKHVGLDPSTGKIDIDIVEGGTPKSERDRIDLIIDTIKELGEDNDGLAMESELYTKMAEVYSVNNREVDKLMNRLRNKGMILEPRYGVYKVV